MATAITALWLTDFRCFEEASFEPDPDGLTVLRGENGAGKTSVLEAVAWLATQRSFRGAAREALVRRNSERSVIRATVRHPERRVLLEAELPVQGVVRMQLNRQPVRRRAELAEVFTVSVFSPDDLALVQGGPDRRRHLLDEVLASRHPRHQTLVDDVERVVRQRNALLRQSSGQTRSDVLDTLDVWDARLSAAGDALAGARRELVEVLGPLVRRAYAQLADAHEADDLPSMQYRQSWEGTLEQALSAARHEDLRRQVSTVGPHRDELAILLGDRPARTQASQGEQRTCALALRLAAHLLVTEERGQPPVLLLDDVFSELDHRRAAALVGQLPTGQVLLTTAVDPPPAVSPDRVVEVSAGRLATSGGR